MTSCPGLSRASTFLLTFDAKDVDGRDKPGHDENERADQLARDGVAMARLKG